MRRGNRPMPAPTSLAISSAREEPVTMHGAPSKPRPASKAMSGVAPETVITDQARQRLQNWRPPGRLRRPYASIRCFKFSSYITCWIALPVGLAQSVASSAMTWLVEVMITPCWRMRSIAA